MEPGLPLDAVILVHKGEAGAEEAQFDPGEKPPLYTYPGLTGLHVNNAKVTPNYPLIARIPLISLI